LDLESGRKLDAFQLDAGGGGRACEQRYGEGGDGLHAVLRDLRVDHAARAEIPASSAPPQNVAAGPTNCHKAPASALATSMAMPLARLKTPKAVPRSAAGEACATIAERTPCVKPMCRPQRATPIEKSVMLAAN